MDNLEASTNRVNESEKMVSDDPSTSSSATKKRKLSDDNEYQDEIDSMKTEMEEMKKLIEKQKDMIHKQSITIGKLQDERDAAKAVETELYLKNEEYEQKEREGRALATDREKQLEDLQNQLEQARTESAVRFVELDEVRDDRYGRSQICYDRLWDRCNIPVIKIDKFDIPQHVHQHIRQPFHRKVRNELDCDGLYELQESIYRDMLDRKISEPDENEAYNLRKRLNKVLRFQVNGELNLYDWLYQYTLSNIHSCNLTKLDFKDVTICYEDFMKLISSRTITTLIAGSVKHENGDGYLGIVEILKELPNLECFETKIIVGDDSINLIELPDLPNLRQFKLTSLKLDFNLPSFADLIIKYQNVEFIFEYYGILWARTKTHSKIVKSKEKELRKKLPRNCNVTVDY